MNFKPSNFYIGIIDLFAILLPGAIVSLIIYYMDWLGIKSWLIFPKDNNAFYTVFLFLLSAYLIGHIVSQLSSYLDKWVYGKMNGKWVYHKEKHRQNLESVKKIRREIYKDRSGTNHLNNFEWSKNKLLLELPPVIDEIDRYLADSKFFRSLILIFPLLAGVLWYQKQSLFGWICIALMAFSAVRYFHKKRKATETAYKGVVFLEKLHRGKASDQADEPEGENQLQYRRGDNPKFRIFKSQIEFLNSGFKGRISHIEIPSKRNWTTQTSTAENEVWCCLQGNGVMVFPEMNSFSKTIISPNASVLMPKSKRVEIKNDGLEPLMLVSISLD